MAPCPRVKERSGAYASSNRQRRAAQILRPLHLDQHAEAFLVRIAFLLGLDETLPDLLLDRTRLVNLGGPVEARDAAPRQKPLLAQRRLAKIDRDLGAVREIARGRSFATLPQREMLVVVDHRAAARGDLRITVGQRRADQADMSGIRRIDVLLQNFRKWPPRHPPSVGYVTRR